MAKGTGMRKEKKKPKQKKKVYSRRAELPARQA